MEICRVPFPRFPGGRQKERIWRERSSEIVLRIRSVAAWVDRGVVVIMVLIKRARSVVRGKDAVRGGEEAMIVGLSRSVVAGG